MKTIQSTTTSPITATFTKWDDQWAIRTNRPITKHDYSLEERPVLGGGVALIDACYVEVTMKNGGTKTVEVLEYEKSFGDSHIYSIR